MDDKESINSHTFEFFGGVTKKMVPDNQKAAVAKASFSDPIINLVCIRLAEHYGFIIVPAHPTHHRSNAGWRITSS